MFLKKFTLKNEQGKIIREVTFKKGLNIILGKDSNAQMGSSNSLGKTTLIRCIDFCLGGKNADEIYKDSEFKTSNTTVETFLKQTKPTFSLTLSRTFESTDEIIIERKLDLSASRNQITNFVNGETYGKSAFEEELKKQIFGFNADKPTFRQLIGKFIRKRDDQISQILKFNGSFCSNLEYEKIHLFLLGFSNPELIAEKAHIETELKKAESAAKMLTSRSSQSALEQKLYLLQEEVNGLKEQRDRFQIAEKYETEAAQLEKLQLQLNDNERTLADYKLQHHAATERIAQLRQDRVKLSSNALQYLYQEAKYYNEKLSRTFDETVAFHNTMLENEIHYLEKTVKNTADTILKLESVRPSIATEYNKLLAFLGKTGSLAEYTKLNDQIAVKSEEIGKISALIDEIEKCKDEIDKWTENQEKVSSNIQNQMHQLDEKLKIFNKHFSEYTNQLIGEKYLLAYSKDSGVYKFGIEGMNSNQGTGQKQSIVIAFDLAYMAFCNEIKLDRPLFATQDKIEVIDMQKLTELFRNANLQNGQLLAPVILDKVAGYEDLEENTVLSLNQNDKFFCIENTPGD